MILSSKQYKCSDEIKSKFKHFQIVYQKMQALNTNTTIKLAIEHNKSSMKVLEARYDLNQTILAVKENIEMRYGSLVPFIRLQLKDTKNNLIA